VAFNENIFHQSNSLLRSSPRDEEYLGPGVTDFQRKIEVETTTLDALKITQADGTGAVICPDSYRAAI
jgi:hypothetical protein